MGYIYRRDNGVMHASVSIFGIWCYGTRNIWGVVRSVMAWRARASGKDKAIIKPKYYG